VKASSSSPSFTMMGDTMKNPNSTSSNNKNYSNFSIESLISPRSPLFPFNVNPWQLQFLQGQGTPTTSNNSSPQDLSLLGASRLLSNNNNNKDEKELGSGGGGGFSSAALQGLLGGPFGGCESSAVLSALYPHHNQLMAHLTSHYQQQQQQQPFHQSQLQLPITFEGGGSFLQQQTNYLFGQSGSGGGDRAGDEESVCSPESPLALTGESLHLHCPYIPRAWDNLR
jgi:hypothetical protein